MPKSDVGDLIGSIVDSPFPTILYDGDEDARKFVDGQVPAGLRVCIQESSVTFFGIDIPRLGAFASSDLTPFRLCASALAGGRDSGVSR